MYEPKEPRRAYTIDEGPEGKMGWPIVKYADFFLRIYTAIHVQCCSLQCSTDQGDDAVFCQITVATCFLISHHYILLASYS